MERYQGCFAFSLLFIHETHFFLFVDDYDAIACTKATHPPQKDAMNQRFLVCLFSETR